MAVTRSRTRKAAPSFETTDVNTTASEATDTIDTDTIVPSSSTTTSTSMTAVTAATSTSTSSSSQRPKKRRKLKNPQTQKKKQPVKQKKKQSQTLQELINQSYQNNPLDWQAILQRCQSNPNEILPKHLYSVLMVHCPTIVPGNVIRAMIQYANNNLFTLPALQFAFTCPWISLQTIRALLDGPRRLYPGDDEMPWCMEEDGPVNDEHDEIINYDEENSDNEYELHLELEMAASGAIKTAKLHEHCSTLLHSLYQESESLPPNYDAVKIMLRYIPRVLNIQDHSDSDLPLHSACWSERNAKFIELFVQSSMDMEDDPDYPKRQFGGLLVSNEFGISPLKLIIQKWKDDSAAKMVKKLIQMSNMTKIAISESKILHEAIEYKKWNIVKTIIPLSPQSLAKVKSQWKLPLHTVCALPAPDDNTTNTNNATLNTEIIQFMIEQSILNDEVGLVCGGLLARDWNDKTPLYLLSLWGKLEDAVTVMNTVAINAVTTTDNAPNATDTGTTTDNTTTTNTANTTNMPTTDTTETNENNTVNTDKSSAAMGILKHVIKFILKKKRGKDKDIHIGKIVHEAISIKNWQLIEHIAQTYPKSLSLKDGRDNLPIHTICQTDAPFEIMKLFIETGTKHKIGKRKNRAGLFEENKNGERPLELIMGRKCTSNGKFFKFLQSFKPKLFTKKDIKDLNLLHKVADGGLPTVARALLKSVPTAISLQDKDGNLPIHIVCEGSSTSKSRELLALLLQYGLKEKVGGSTGYGGLYVKNSKNLTAMDIVLNRYICFSRYGHGQRKWANISVIMKHVPEAPILQSAINLDVSTYLKPIVMSFPDSVHVRDLNKQLPIHVALTKGVHPEMGLDLIVETYPVGLSEIDPVTGLLPFALAAKDTYSLKYVHSLLLQDPTFFSSKEWLPIAKNE